MLLYDLSKSYAAQMSRVSIPRLGRAHYWQRGFDPRRPHTLNFGSRNYHPGFYGVGNSGAYSLSDAQGNQIPFAGPFGLPQPKTRNLGQWEGQGETPEEYALRISGGAMIGAAPAPTSVGDMSSQETRSYYDYVAMFGEAVACAMFPMTCTAIKVAASTGTSTGEEIQERAGPVVDLARQKAQEAANWLGEKTSGMEMPDFEKYFKYGLWILGIYFGIQAIGLAKKVF